MNMPILFPNNNCALTFVRVIFHQAEGGFIVLWLKLPEGSSETYSFPVTNLEGAAAKLAELAQRGDTYVARGLQAVQPGAGKRGDEAGVIFVGGLFADIDTREGPHKGTPPNELPADEKEALKLIAEAGLPLPTLLVHTGGGCHPHWLYTSPTMLLTLQERAAEKVLSKALQKRLRDTFQGHGYTLDATHDLTRVCKSPGTLNHKTAPDLKPVRMVSTGPRYDRAEMLSILADDLAMAARGVAGAGKGTVAAAAREKAKKDRIAAGMTKPDEVAPMLAGCAFLQHCDASAEQLPEPWWYKMVGLVSRTVGGRGWVHEMSKRYAGYSFEETEAKIDHALEGATGPTWCSTVAEDFEGCASCPFRASIRTPMTLANQPLALVEVQFKAVFVVKGRTWLDLRSGEKLDPEEFGDSIMSRVGSAPHKQMMLSKTTPKVLHQDYLAGVSWLILQEPDGSLAVNLWQRGGVIPAAGDVKLILDFFDWLILDPRERDHLLRYLAHLVQHPAVKIEHGIILTDGYGTGKGTLHRIITAIFGDKNARKVEGVELASDYTARLVDAQVLMIEEAHHGERLEVFEKTKELLTAEFYYAHDKHVRRFRGRTPRGLFLASNDVAPLVLPRGDRRWAMFTTRDTPTTDEEKKVNRAFFKHFHDALNRDDSAVAAFAEYLRTLSLEGFDAKGAAPTTAAKEAATKASLTPTADVLTELVTEGLAPFHKDVVDVAEVKQALSAPGSVWASSLERLSPRKIAKAMRDVGARQVNMDGNDHLELALGGGKKTRPWAIRDTARWRTATREELKAEFQRPRILSGDNIADIREASIRRAAEEAAKEVARA